jgi:hypothetical protein
MSGPSQEQDPAVLEAAVRAGHEEDVVGSRILFTAAAAFIGLVLLGVFAVYVVQPLMIASQEADSPPANPLSASYGRVEPPAPRLQVDPALDIFDHRKAEQQALTSYGWVDRNAGVVRIPIDRAMALLVERGDAAPRTQPAQPDPGAPASASVTGTPGERAAPGAGLAPADAGKRE